MGQRRVHGDPPFAMAIEISPVPYSAPAQAELADTGFGAVVSGVNPNDLSANEFAEIEQLLYKHGVLVFKDAHMTPEGQYKLTKMFDPPADSYGHGAVGRPNNKSILHPDLRTIPSVPAVQLIGNGFADDPQVLHGLNPIQLRHPSHETFHATEIPEEKRLKGNTRFYRWHIDSALYRLHTPKVTTLYGLRAPQGKVQTVHYDDGSNETLDVPLGGTAFVSGKKMFDILPPQLKSLAVRTKVRYHAHPYVWITPAKSRPTGLGMETEGKEMSDDDLPPFEEEHVKILPMVWKNAVTGDLHYQVHPSGIEALHIDALPAGVEPTENTLYPNGAHLTDLGEVRDLVYSMQRPAISPQYVYTHDWSPNDLCIFHNRGVLHSITGSFAQDELRCFWQCNLAASEGPVGPSADDVRQYV